MAHSLSNVITKNKKNMSDLPLGSVYNARSSEHGVRLLASASIKLAHFSIGILFILALASDAVQLKNQ